MQAATEFQSYETSIAAAAFDIPDEKVQQARARALDFLNAHRLTGTWKKGQPM
jgi:hypothetical protein